VNRRPTLGGQIPQRHPPGPPGCQHSTISAQDDGSIGVLEEAAVELLEESKMRLSGVKTALLAVKSLTESGGSRRSKVVVSQRIVFP
jgi:hypothetical protein